MINIRVSYANNVKTFTLMVTGWWYAACVIERTHIKMNISFAKNAINANLKRKRILFIVMTVKTVQLYKNKSTANILMNMIYIDVPNV